IKGDSGVGAKLHGDRRDPGSYGGPRRLSTPTLTDFHQIRLGRRIHAAHAPATGPTPPSTVFRDLLERPWGRIRFPEENGSDPILIFDT
ncbi:hypothetical protein ACMV5Z_15815, partial [Stenotrophomonas maltophilia]|uniref:hypothetical protein n=1 Tax=Stenotrophomonas maltophilia TaxID=40324 RepID=UPI0039DFADFC